MSALGPKAVMGSRSAAELVLTSASDPERTFNGATVYGTGDRVKKRTPMAVVVLAAMVAGGCSSSSRHHLDDAAGDFCVPEGQTVADVWWVPADPPGAPHGFAFAGCDGVRGSDAAQCPFPSSISGGVVEQRSAFRSQRWADFGAESTLKSEILSSTTVIKTSERDGTLTVHRGRNWDVWSHVVTPDTQRESPQLADDDVLLASCHANSEPLAGDNSWAAGLECRRAVLASDYSLEYSFRSESMSHESMRHLDGLVIGAINQWQCGGRR